MVMREEHVIVARPTDAVEFGRVKVSGSQC